MSTENVFCQRWTESENDGWVSQRPDGYSLHVTKEDVKKYIDEYTKGRTGPTPSCYDFASGEPFIVRVSKKDHAKLVKLGGSDRCFGKQPEQNDLVELKSS